MHLRPEPDVERNSPRIIDDNCHKCGPLLVFIVVRSKDAEMRIETASIGKKRQISGSVLITLGGLMLIGSAGAKLTHVPQVVDQLAAMGFEGGRLTFIAVLDIVSAAFLVPFTRS
jgi:hypothetical protein